jgi:crotonobetainyl-CoA:carnitine CoA-transferase CaiB-like acyl-CoA transferase
MSTGRTIDITPTWGEWATIYARFAESGERKACKALREDLARAMAAAQALRSINSTLNDEQARTVSAVIAAELSKQGY